ncbi:MAG: hypothetical protein IJF26_00520 [Clostridia bacterium]|nr:hypothetical protein [Clostridia bacterium]
MNEFFKRNSPPGIDLKQEFRLFLICNIASVIVSFFAFLDKYINARNNLFFYEIDKKILIEGAIIAPFSSLLSVYFSVFFFVTCFMLGYIIPHYLYFRQDSMSIYLMKRLPNKRELHRRALTVPCLAALATIGVALSAILLYFIIYILATPKACLPYAALREIWR